MRLLLIVPLRGKARIVLIRMGCDGYGTRHSETKKQRQDRYSLHSTPH